MKKLILSILTIAVFYMGNAQIVTIPDTNFKTYLLSNSAINTNGDSEIQVSEANAYTGIIYVSNSNISSLTGIQYFIQLTELYCSGNQLTSLNVSNIIPLTILSCDNNQLTSLNIGNFTSLSNLSCANNELTTLDVTYNTSLVVLSCNNNQISVLDTSNLVLLEELSCRNNQISVLNFSTSRLINLYCNNNTITSLDLSNNTNLSWLDCSNNQISSLNITGLTNLYSLYANNNLLTHLDVSSHSSLAILDVSNNQLIYLNVRNNGNFDFEIFDARQNILSCIEVDDATWSTANWTDIDNYVYFSETPCQPCEISIPDVSFRNYLLGNPLININGDNAVQCAEAHNFTGVIDINNLSVSDMTGIEEFYHLTVLRSNDNQISTIDLSSNDDLIYLDIGNNDITSIDVSNNTALETLHIYNNYLSNLNVTSNTNLTDLRCDNNIINSLDISNNILLTSLNCGHNNLPDLDVTYNSLLTSLNCRDNQIEILKVLNNTLLNSLDCKNNQIAELDLTNNTVLTYLRCESNVLTGLDVANGNNTNFIYFNALNNPDLTCINVDDTAWSTTNWTNIDTQSSFSENCYAPKTYVPDDNFEQALIDLGYDTAMDNYVFTADINTITVLDVSNKNISDLTGIEDFIALINLNCSNNQLTSLTIINDLDNLDNLNCNFNQLTSLDVEDNISLTVLACRANQLTTLYVSNNTYLEFLSCRDNLLTDLDVSNNPDLVRLWCFNNQLTTLNIKNGSNTNITNSNFNAINNPNLTCIEVDNAAWSTANWINIDAQSSFSENCSVPQTYVPDDNFEQALIDLGYDTTMDNYVFTADINTITVLDVSNKNISDLTGIEDFIALINLNCSNNQLTSLTIINDLDSLDNLNCNFNQLTSLDVEDNIALTVLACRANQLTTLYVSNNTYLEFLSCRDNLLTDLDVSNNPDLVRLWCFNNQLTSLSIKNGSNTNIANSNFNAINNPNLTCIEVDNTAWSTINWTNIDAAASFSENCVLSIDQYSLENAFTIYPNPIKDNLNIQNNSSYTIDKITIYNMLGKTIYSSNVVSNIIDVADFSNGVYFVKITSNNKSITKKIILR